MGLIRGYRNDVFISYAHQDNVADFDGTRHVSRLVSFLEQQLRQRVGARGEYQIFFDNRDLQSNHEVDTTLREAKASALFVAITSPSYVDPAAYTLREMAAFLETDAARDRFFSLEILPIDDIENYPDVLNARKRHKFWQDGGSDSRVAMPLDPAVHPADYKIQLTAFADQLARQLIALHKEAGDAAPAAGAAGAGAVADAPGAAPAEPIGTILLTQANDDVEFQRAEVVAFLEQANVRVLPERDYPQGGEDFKAAFAADLAEADLMVQLLGGAAGRMPSDLPQGYQHHQHATAMAAGKPLMAWRHPELNMDFVTSPVQRELLDSSVTQVEGLQSFKTEIMRRLEEATKPPPPPKAEAHTKMIYVGANTVDRDLVAQIQQVLRDRRHPVTTPIFEGTAEEMQQDFEDCLRESAKIVIVQGDAPVSWVRSYLRRVDAQLDHEDPPDIAALFKAPPSPKPDPGVWYPYLEEVDSSDELDIERLCAVLESKP